MVRRSSEGIVQAAIMRAASWMGTEAEGGDVRQAAEVVVVEAMQVGSIEAARAEVADAVKAMGWGATEATIMKVSGASTGWRGGGGVGRESVGSRPE